MLSPKRLLNTSDLRAKKALGQNFLTDLSTAKMIVEKSRLEPEAIVLEIGAGLGALTIPVAKSVSMSMPWKKTAVWFRFWKIN
jgi:16S rRNA (adenine1518-N6/adenine1519-N6)-dimethyltransferase